MAPPSEQTMNDNVSEHPILDYCTSNSTGNDTIFYYNLSQDTSHEFVVVYISLLSLIIACGVLGNSMVLLLVLLDKRLRYRSIIASLSIVLCDLLLTIFYHGVALTGAVLKRWPYGKDDEGTCNAYAISTLCLLYVRWLAISTIAIDRFCTVYFPFKYPRYSKKVLVVLTVLTWGVPLAVTISNIYISSPTFRPNIPTCLPSCINKEGTIRLLCRILNVSSVIFVLVVGIFTPSAVYTWLYYKGRQFRRQPQLGTNETTSNNTQNSAFTTQEQKALVTLFLLYMTVLITTLPQVLIGLTRYNPNCLFFRIPLELHLSFSLVFFSSTSLDPIVLLRHQDFRIAIKEILCCRRKSSIELIRVQTVNERRKLQDPPITVTGTTLSRNIVEVCATNPLVNLELQGNSSSTLLTDSNELWSTSIDSTSFDHDLNSRYKLSKFKVTQV